MNKFYHPQKNAHMSRTWGLSFVQFDIYYSKNPENFDIKYIDIVENHSNNNIHTLGNIDQKNYSKTLLMKCMMKLLIILKKV